MNGWAAAIVVMALVVNPPGVSHEAAWGDRSSATWRRAIATALAVTTAVWAATGLITGPLLEGLDLSGPTFRLGASVVVGITGARWFVARPPKVTSVDDARSGVAHLLITLLPPGPIFAAMAANADAGAAAGLVSVIIAACLTAVALLIPRPGDPVGPWISRLVGAATIVVAVAIGIDSARSV